jgi:O-antigen/teichoic acid export membrane protein
VNFGGRIAGIAVTFLVIRYTGVGPAVAPLLLALALFSFGQSSLAGPLEIQAIAEIGATRLSPPSRLLSSSLFMGAALGAVLIAISIVLSRLVPGASDVAWYFLPLGLALPLAACFSAVQGIEIACGSWSMPGVASFLRTGVIVSVVGLLIAHVGVIVVPFAFLLGESARLGLIGYRTEVLKGLSLRIDAAFCRRIAQQVPASMVGSVAPTVDRFLISAFGLGSIGILDLADKATGFFNLSFAQGLLPPMYRSWTRIEDPVELRRRVLGVAGRVFVSSVVLGLIAALVIPPLIAGAAGVSEPTDRAFLDATIWCLLAGFPAYVTSQVLVRLMILQRLQYWFNVTATVQLVANVLLDLLLGFRWGVSGVAAATSLVWWLGLVLCLGIIRRRVTTCRHPSIMRRPRADAVIS